MALFMQFLMEEWVLVMALVFTLFLLSAHESKRAGKKISPQQAINLANQQQAVLIDLRDAGDYRKGHIVDAQNIPYASFPKRIGELEKYREQPIVLVCKMGQHASAAGKQLTAQGFPQVYRLSGGMTEWQGMQLPTAKGA